MKKLEGKIAVVTGASAETLHIAGGSHSLTYYEQP